MKDRYLGDGVYASHDGYQVWLAVNDYTNKVVALEPAVMRALEQYVADEQQERIDLALAETTKKLGAI